MLAQTVDRLKDLVSPEHVFVITNAEQRDAVRKLSATAARSSDWRTPGRDTAAAVGLAACWSSIRSLGLLLPAASGPCDRRQWGFCKVCRSLKPRKRGCSCYHWHTP